MEYLTAADSAKHIRAELKAMFPKTKFSVRSSSYSLGSNVSVHWTDGPTEESVTNVIDCLTADMRHIHDISLDTEYNGISFTREISKETWNLVKAEVINEMMEADDPYITDSRTVDRRVSYEIEERSFL